MTKVKGHAKSEHIEKGITTAEHALGNAQSDANADKGHTQHGNDAANLSNWFQLRHQYFASFMRNLQEFIIAVLHENRRLRRIKLMVAHPFAKKPPPVKMVIPTKLIYGS